MASREHDGGANILKYSNWIGIPLAVATAVVGAREINLKGRVEAELHKQGHTEQIPDYLLKQVKRASRRSQQAVETTFRGQRVEFGQKNFGELARYRSATAKTLEASKKATARSETLNQTVEASLGIPFLGLINPGDKKRKFGLKQATLLAALAGIMWSCAGPAIRQTAIPTEAPIIATATGTPRVEASPTAYVDTGLLYPLPQFINEEVGKPLSAQVLSITDANQYNYVVNAVTQKTGIPTDSVDLAGLTVTGDKGSGNYLFAIDKRSVESEGSVFMLMDVLQDQHYQTVKLNGADNIAAIPMITVQSQDGTNTFLMGPSDARGGLINPIFRANADGSVDFMSLTTQQALRLDATVQKNLPANFVEVAFHTSLPTQSAPESTATAVVTPTEAAPKEGDTKTVTENGRDYRYSYDTELGWVREIASFPLLDDPKYDYMPFEIRVTESVQGERTIYSMSHKPLTMADLDANYSYDPKPITASMGPTLRKTYFSYDNRSLSDSKQQENFQYEMLGQGEPGHEQAYLPVILSDGTEVKVKLSQTSGIILTIMDAAKIQEIGGDHVTKGYVNGTVYYAEVYGVDSKGNELVRLAFDIPLSQVPEESFRQALFMFPGQLAEKKDQRNIGPSGFSIALAHVSSKFTMDSSGIPGSNTPPDLDITYVQSQP